MPSRRLIPLLALAALAAAGTAQAQKLSVTVGGASDYVFRGVSQTDSKPFAFAALNLSAGQFYAGAGAENVDFGNSIDAEYDLYAGWKPKLAGVDLDFGVVRYGYVNQPRHIDIDTVELKAGASVPVSGARLGGLVAWTPDYWGSGKAGTYVEANASAPPLAGWSLAGGVGRQDMTAGGDYWTWNLGASRAFGRVVVDLRYHDTDVHGRGDRFKSRAVATLKASF
ncbi:TorF family putative porin [Phenylobacterium sp.]|uniref:TorF family putative porin n=1 Tax=Phenylobacterium sp. TaxID=1871053 RepID=UPI002FC73C7F